MTDEDARAAELDAEVAMILVAASELRAWASTLARLAVGAALLWAATR